MTTQQPGQAARYTAVRPVVLSVAKLSLMGLLPLIHAIPLSHSLFNAFAEDEEPPMSPQKPTLWIYLAVAIALVLLGGAFAGLTIALMGQVGRYCGSQVRMNAENHLGRDIPAGH